MTKGVTAREVRDRFIERYGHAPAVVGVAPGRINLIGEHTDYNDGFVFPAAIDRVTYIAASPKSGKTALFSMEAGEGQPFDANTVKKGEVEGWAVYPAGMAWTLRTTGERLPNLEVLVSSTVPRSGGVSSSAALEMAFGVVWNKLAKLSISAQDLAEEGKICENQFVGVNSGIMDQMASAMGKAGHAMFLDTRTLAIQYAPIPQEYAAVLCDTKKPRALTDSAYNERRSQCEEAARTLGVPKLRDATMEMLDRSKSKLTDVVYMRARHVITENARCIAFYDTLKAGDVTSAGRLINESHASLRDDYEVSCRELDVMAEAASSSPGCIGARMMGAGFGGSCIALVKRDELDAFTERTLGAYVAETGLSGEIWACRLVDGARLVDPSSS